MSGLLIAAPSSGSGKTTVTLGLLRALARRGVAMAPGKAGPDYIDPAFHAHASGTDCLNFDPWAMRDGFLTGQAVRHSGSGRLLVIEAMMGLFDAAADGQGSPADLARLLQLNVVLVVDCARLSHSVAAIVHGYSTFRPDVRVAGVILNRVGSDRHEKMLRDALAPLKVSLLGVIRADAALALPERHLGLVQAGEHAGLEAFVDRAADAVATGCDLDAIIALADGLKWSSIPEARPVRPLLPLGQHIAIARDVAFAFCYPHLLQGWLQQGASLSFFSPLADEAPSQEADAIYLPGGYPELHAGTLSGNQIFRAGMVAAKDRGCRIFGECGGYMVLGDGLVDSAGQAHAMLGFLPLTTSFETRKRHLGYRRVVPLPGSGFDGPMTAHEFHYSTIVSEGTADRLFAVSDASGTDFGQAGLRRGQVAGSYLHLIDRLDSAEDAGKAAE